MTISIPLYECFHRWWWFWFWARIAYICDGVWLALLFRRNMRRRLHTVCEQKDILSKLHRTISFSHERRGSAGVYPVLQGWARSLSMFFFFYWLRNSWGKAVWCWCWTNMERFCMMMSASVGVGHKVLSAEWFGNRCICVWSNRSMRYHIGTDGLIDEIHVFKTLGGVLGFWIFWSYSFTFGTKAYISGGWLRDLNREAHLVHYL